MPAQEGCGISQAAPLLHPQLLASRPTPTCLDVDLPQNALAAERLANQGDGQPQLRHPPQQQVQLLGEACLQRSQRLLGAGGGNWRERVSATAAGSAREQAMGVAVAGPLMGALQREAAQPSVAPHALPNTPLQPPPSLPTCPGLSRLTRMSWCGSGTNRPLAGSTAAVRLNAILQQRGGGGGWVVGTPCRSAASLVALSPIPKCRASRRCKPPGRP